MVRDWLISKYRKFSDAERLLMSQKSAFSTDGSRSKTVFRERRLTVESITKNI